MKGGYSPGFKEACKQCDHAKAHMGGGCYCLKYGIIIGYPKLFCVGFEPKKEGQDENDGNVSGSNGECD